MRTILLLLVAGLVVTIAAAPGPAFAQTSIRYTTVVSNQVPPVTYTIEAVYWPTNSEFVASLADSGGNIATWNTAMYGVDFRVDTRSHWGLHLNAMTGNQSSWSFLGSGGVSLSGTDTIWSVDVSYLWQQPVPDNPAVLTTFRGFVGWGDAKASTTMGNLTSLGFAFNSATLVEESSGFRVGFDFTYPFQSGWSINGGLAYFPSTNTTGTVVARSIGSSAISAGGTGWDASAGIRYTFAGGFDVEAGYRLVRQNVNAFSVAGVAVCPCHTQWTGPYGAVGVTF